MCTAKVKEIIKDDVHCFSDCGFNCKAEVKEELEAHYRSLADALPGWTVRTWHNCGWHCCLEHKSGFQLRDYSLRGGVREVSRDMVAKDRRFYCNNYSGDFTGQIREYGSTPEEAIDACLNSIATRAAAYVSLLNELSDKEA